MIHLSSDISSSIKNKERDVSRILRLPEAFLVWIVLCHAYANIS